MFKSLIPVLALFLFLGAAAPKTPVDLFKTAKLSIVEITHPMPEEKIGRCTGFVVDAPRGWVLTVRHCLNPDGDTFVDGVVSKVLKQSELFALLSDTPMTKPPLQIRTDKPQIGERAVTVGYGFGILTLLDRTVAAFNDEDIALDGPTIPGMSGGPILDVTGKVIGINQGNVLGNGGALGVGCGIKEIREFIKGF